MAGNWLTDVGVLYALSWLIVIVALYVVPRNRKPGAATAWLMLIVMVPFAGAALYLMIGSPKLSRHRRALQRRADELIADRVRDARRNPALAEIFDPPVADRFQPIVNLNANLGGMPACSGNQVTLIADYARAIRSITEAIDAAQLFVHVQFYILALDDATEPFFAALENAVRRGVTVRVLADHMASRSYARRDEWTARLTTAGIEWHWTLPWRPLSNDWNRPDLRNHRKIVVIDGQVAFTGSMNMIDRSYQRRRNLRSGRYYSEVIAQCAGPVATEANVVFLSDWHAEGGSLTDAQHTTAIGKSTGTALCQVLPSGPGYDNDNNLKLFTSLIHAARQTVCITTPYFVPDDSLMTAITSAAQRGVRVDLQTTQASNQVVVYHAQHSYYEELLRAGVHIHLLQPPELLHAKHLSIDDDIAVIGSSNLDMRSFTLNLEVTLVAYDASVVGGLRAVEAGFRGRSRELTAEEWSHESVLDRLMDNLARLTASLQ